MFEDRHGFGSGSMRPAPGVPPQSLNPWLAILTEPRECIRQLIAEDNGAYVLLLGALGGITFLTGRLSGTGYHAEIDYNTVVLFLIPAGLVLGPVYIYIASAFIRLAGFLLGLSASMRNIRAAMAWSAMPGLYLLPFTLIIAALYGPEYFAPDKFPPEQLGGLSATILSWYAVPEGIAQLWSLVLFVNALGEVEGVSAWKSSFLLILASMLPALLMFGIYMLYKAF